jgi:hypothetical protein
MLRLKKILTLLFPIIFSNRTPALPLRVPLESAGKPVDQRDGG